MTLRIKKKKKTAEKEEVFWESLWFIHALVYILAYIEVILKGFLLYYLIADFKEKYKFGDLLNFNYDDGKGITQQQNAGDEQQMNFDNSINNFVNESNFSYAEHFQNHY